MAWKRITGFWLTTLGIAVVAQAQSAPALGVSDLVDRALAGNRDWLAAKQRAVEAQGLVRQAGLRPAPAIGVELESARPFGTRGETLFSAGYAHTFETFGKQGKRVAVASKGAEAVDADLADRMRLLTLDVKTRHAQAIAEQNKLATIERLAATNREHFDLTSARIEQGDAAPLEGQLLLAELNRMEAQQILQAGRAERALIELRKVVGMAAAEPLTLQPAPPPGMVMRTLADLQAQALRDRPDLHAAQRLREQAQAEVALAQVDSHTDITALARYARSESSFDQLGFDLSGRLVPLHDLDHSLTVALSFFVPTPKRAQGAVEVARARATSAALRGEHLESVVRLDVEAAYRRWESARRAVAILASGVVTPSAQNLSVLRQAYSLGQLRMFDVLNEQRRLLETELAYLDAQAELSEAFAELEASVGGPLR
jgi:cobalt-zinc-cadmium efflux system outer membrane protein